MLIDQFNAAHPEYRAEALALPYDVYPSKLSAAIPTGHGPDVFIFAQERVSAWARDGLLSPMDADAAMMPGEFPEAALDALRSKGALWGLPLSLKSVALYVNKSLVPVAPVNTDEMVALAQKLTDPAQGRFGLAWEAGDFYHHASWLSGFGGKLFKEPEHRPVVDTPEGVAALTFVRDLMRKKHVMPEEPSAQLVATLFNANRAAMVINGPWFAGEIHGVDYEVVSLPIVSATGLPARPLLTVEAALVSATSEVKDGARALARFLVSKDASILRAKIGRQVVATRSAYDDPGVGGDTLLRAFRKQAESAVPMDNTPAMLTVWEPYKRALTAVLSGLLEPDEALAQAQRRLNAIAKPMPPPASPWPLLLLAAGGILALSIWIRRRPVRPDAPALYHDVRRAIAYCTPAAASILVLVFIPFAIGVGLAFFHHGEGRYTFVGLSNFVDILTSRDYRITEPMSFWFTLAVTLAWTVANVVLHVSIGLFLALLLRDPLLKFKGVYRVLLIVPWAVPNYITALVWKGMFHRQFGAISALLATLGLEPVSWFTRFSTSFAANVVTNTWLGFPFMMVVSLGALQSIPQDLYEAAEVDGASKWAQFRHITLPLLRPALLPAVILGSVWTFNMFNIIYLVSGGEPGGATDILVSEAYRWAFQRNEQFGFAAAYSTLIFLFLLGWSALTRRVAREPSPEAA
ncbi:MAG: extracellular solute-binding protein [Deltaproteobacteria bacterium]|nr:extracellular solute-binding protein [Deltaproteobacteria bacterium]